MAKPLELENKSGLFFVSAAILALLALWAAYEETFTRRPWKDYQQAFFDIQVERAEAKLAAAEERFTSGEVQGELEQLRADLSAAKATLAAPEARAAYADAMASRETLTVRAGELKQELGAEKSRVDAAFSRYTEAKHHGEGRKAYLEEKKIAELEASVAELEVEAKQVNDELAAAIAVIEGHTGPVTKIEERIAEIEGEVESAHTALAKAKGQSPELTQIWLPDIQVVDRCHNCHAGIDRTGFSDPKEVVAFALSLQDQNKELDEAVRRYGVSLETIEGWIEATEEGKEIDDGVPGVLRAHPERWDLLVKAHPPESFACTTCHEGQGAQTKGIGSILGAYEFDHGRNDHYWLWPMMKGEFTQSTCVDCHEGDHKLKFADRLNKGQALIDKVGCTGCHPIGGYEPERKVGPTLTHLKAKSEPGWVAAWLANPKGWRPNTSMPNFWPEAVDDSLPEWEREKFKAQRDAEVEAITAYLWTSSKGAAGYLSKAPNAGDAGRGKAIVETVGCYGCHAVEEKDDIVHHPGSDTRAVGPKLSRVAEKASFEWLYSWVRDPEALWHDTRMPSLRLSDQEAADVAAYLAGLGTGRDYPASATFSNGEALAAASAKGKTLVAKYGCFGCHDINGFETAQRIGADLSDFGRKSAHLLDFGHEITDPHEKTWENWIYTKLKTPHAFRTERIDTRMPQFDFSEDEIKSLMVFLRSRRNEARPAPYNLQLKPERQAMARGERLVINFNCRGCHMIRGEGGQIASRYENKNAAPPELFRLGAKTKPEWLHHFIKAPETSVIRPWIEVRMPTFPLRPSELTDLVAYFNALDGSVYPYALEAEDTDRATLAAGKELFDRLRCVQCHLTSGTVPATADLAAVAPDLSTAGSKLRQEWIHTWLADPNAQQPGSRMPGFWPEGFAPYQDILGGDAEAQMKAVGAYVYSLGQGRNDG